MCQCIALTDGNAWWYYLQEVPRQSKPADISSRPCKACMALHVPGEIQKGIGPGRNLELERQPCTKEITGERHSNHHNRRPGSISACVESFSLRTIVLQTWDQKVWFACTIEAGVGRWEESWRQLRVFFSEHWSIRGRTCLLAIAWGSAQKGN